MADETLAVSCLINYSIAYVGEKRNLFTTHSNSVTACNNQLTITLISCLL